MRTSSVRRRGFINESIFRLQLYVCLLSLAIIFVTGSTLVRVLIAMGIAGFFVFVKWQVWKTTLRPGDKVKVLRGEYSGKQGIVHPEHDPQHFGRVRVVLTQDGKESIQEFSQYDIGKT